MNPGLNPLTDVRQGNAHALLDAVVERFRMECRMQAEIGVLLGDISAMGVKTELGYDSLVALLRDVLHITAWEARKRVGRAKVLNRSRAPESPNNSAVAEAALAGALDGARVDAVASLLKRIPAVVPLEERTRAEALLVDIACHGDKRKVIDAGREALARLDPRGTEPQGTSKPLRNELTCRARKDGRMRVTALLDEVTAARFTSLLEPLTVGPNAGQGEGDPRPVAERRGRGFAEILGLATRAPETPTQSGSPAQLVVTVTYKDLLEGVGTGSLDTLQSMPIRDVKRLACDARIMTGIIGEHSEPLELGRSRHYATAGQWRYLSLRDGGCSFPGCRRAPKHCEVHHVVPWFEGGPTDVGNMAMLCPLHHTWVHDTAWEVIMGSDGKPSFIPPAYQDPRRRPRRNDVKTGRAA